MSSSAMDTEDLTRFAAGRRAVRGTRLRRALIARLLSEQGEEPEEEGDEGTSAEGGDEDRQLVRLLVGSRLLRRKRLRRLLIAHLIRERGDSEDEGDEEDEDVGEDGGEDDRRIVRLLIGSRMLRRKRVRRALLAHLLKERGEGEEEEEEGDEGDEDFGEEGGDRDRKFMRMLIASRVLRRKRVRRALIARLIKDRGESEDEGEEDEWGEGDEDSGDEGPDLERQVARLMVGKGMVRRRRARRALVAMLRNAND